MYANVLMLGTFFLWLAAIAAMQTKVAALLPRRKSELENQI